MPSFAKAAARVLCRNQSLAQTNLPPAGALQVRNKDMRICISSRTCSLCRSVNFSNIPTTCRGTDLSNSQHVCICISSSTCSLCRSVNPQTHLPPAGAPACVSANPPQGCVWSRSSTSVTCTAPHAQKQGPAKMQVHAQLCAKGSCNLNWANMQIG
jgi:hypothetical protein